MSLKIKINQLITSLFSDKNKQISEKVLFNDRLIRYDKQIEMEYESIKDADWFQAEQINNISPFLVSPLRLKAKNTEAINEKLDQLKLLRKKANVSSKEIIDGIERLLKYGVWTDHIVDFIEECLNNESLYTSDARLIIATLLENSIRTVRDEDEYDYESYQTYDFEKYFEEHWSLKLKIAGFLDIKLSQTVTPFDEKLLKYHFIIEFDNQKRFIQMESDADIFLLFKSIFNGLLMESGSNMRFYRVQFCPYSILLEKELALELMKNHGILIFHENWSFPTSYPEFID